MAGMPQILSGLVSDAGAEYSRFNDRLSHKIRKWTLTANCKPSMEPVLFRLKTENLCIHTIGPVNICLDKAECIGITGPSGVGKTLFLRAVADMEYHIGKIFLDGVESAHIPAPEWRKKVGMLPAENAWWFDTVGEHFSHSRSGEEKKWFEAVGFPPHVVKWEISRLSSGERQRLALLRLLANHPKVFLLDEPTANLDAENITRIENLITTYRIENESSVIWVTHDTDQLKRVSNRRFLLENGNFSEN